MNRPLKTKSSKRYYISIFLGALPSVILPHGCLYYIKCGSSDSSSISNICFVNYSACYNYNCSHFSWFFYQFNTWACGSWQYCLLILFSFLLLGSTLSTDTYQTVILLSDLEMLCACICLALEKGYDVHPAY